MPLKIRENSLFGRLLRSPWWVSILIGLVISALVPLIVVSKYAHFGVFMAFPFFGIGVYRIFKQRKEPSQRLLTLVQERLNDMSPRDFAKTLTEAFEDDDYVVTASKAKGVDLKLERGEQLIFVSCRRFKVANSGLAPLKALVAAAENQDVGQLIYITLIPASPDVDAYANEHDIQIVGLEPLTELLGKRLEAQAAPS